MLFTLPLHMPSPIYSMVESADDVVPCTCAGSPLQLQASSKDLDAASQPAQQNSDTSTSMPMPAQPAGLLSDALSLEGIVGSLSMDRSLSEFLHEVTCL